MRQRDRWDATAEQLWSGVIDGDASDDEMISRIASSLRAAVEETQRDLAAMLRDERAEIIAWLRVEAGKHAPASPRRAALAMAADGLERDDAERVRVRALASPGDRKAGGGT